MWAERIWALAQLVLPLAVGAGWLAGRRTKSLRRLKLEAETWAALPPGIGKDRIGERVGLAALELVAADMVEEWDGEIRVVRDALRSHQRGSWIVVALGVALNIASAVLLLTDRADLAAMGLGLFGVTLMVGGLRWFVWTVGSINAAKVIHVRLKRHALQQEAEKAPDSGSSV